MTDATTAGGDKIRCDACPVMCHQPGGGLRRANHNGELVRVDPHIVLEERCRMRTAGAVPAGGDWDGKIVHDPTCSRHRDRRRNNLSRLQAGALHRVVGD